ncbi:hypothetical protein MLAC_25840 [Mycobacterium lacus]|uniref:Uncharacterized protein n=1 Tax=Mycobacterium lacus TaxID=169765 RepID=A0A7I7NL91_9MYCO|nr:hypothetical protein MLAC_25840 [Mycobacterium lacus]
MQVPGPNGHSVALHDFGGDGPLTHVFGTLTPTVQQETIASVARLSGTPTIPVDGLSHFGPMEQPWLSQG